VLLQQNTGPLLLSNFMDPSDMSSNFVLSIVGGFCGTGVAVCRATMKTRCRGEDGGLCDGLEIREAVPSTSS
jgi:hypothetical protein